MNCSRAGIGRMMRKEDPRFIRGRGTYVDDVRRGMLASGHLRSPYAHARIVRIDATRRRHIRKSRPVTGADHAKGLA